MQKKETFFKDFCRVLSNRKDNARVIYCQRLTFDAHILPHHWGLLKTHQCNKMKKKKWKKKNPKHYSYDRIKFIFIANHPFNMFGYISCTSSYATSLFWRLKQTKKKCYKKILKKKKEKETYTGHTNQKTNWKWSNQAPHRR